MSNGLRPIVLIGGLVLRADPRRAAVVTLLEFLNALSVGTAPFWLKLLADSALAGDAFAVSLAGTSAALAFTLALFAGWIGTNAQMILQERTSLLLDERMAKLSLDIPGLEHHERPDFQNKLALLRADRELLGQSLAAILAGLNLLIRFTSAVVLLATVDPSLVFLPAFGLALIGTGRKVHQIRQRVREATSESLRTAEHLFRLTTSAQSAKEVLVFGLENELLDRHRQIWADVDHANTKASFLGAGINALGWLVLALGYAGALALTVSKAAQGGATAGDVLMTLGLAAQVPGYVGGTAGLFTWLLNTHRALSRFLWLSDYAAEAGRPAGVVHGPDRLSQGIRLKDLTFRYPGTERDVLSNISLFVPAGTTLAVVGENGAGKTTLVKLLCRFYEPTGGHIIVDGTELRDLEVKSWRRRTTAAFQDFARFEFILRETVGVGDLPNVENVPKVEAAISRAGAEDVLAKLPTGLETQLGRQWDAGTDLSEGQWQELALARALMRERPLLLILDEPTASLDADAEHSLFARYAQAVRQTASAIGTITILVSHRFSTVRMADLILVLEEGRVKELGSHQELIGANGPYAELYRLQARAFR